MDTQMPWELFLAIVAVVIAYFVGRSMGRSNALMERDSFGQPSQKTAVNSPKPARHRKNSSAEPSWSPSTGTAHTGRFTDEQMAHIRNLISRNQKINAIKEVRAITGSGLKEAKDYVDNLTREMGF